LLRLGSFVLWHDRYWRIFFGPWIVLKPVGTLAWLRSWEWLGVERVLLNRMEAMLD
jgi:hypothetical protein